MIEQIQLEREPIEYISVAIEIGNVWVVKLGNDRYQAQLQGADYMPKTFCVGNYVQLVSKEKKIKVRSEQSTVMGCFEFVCDDNCDKQLFNARSIEDKPLYPFDRWDVAAETQYLVAQRNISAYYERIQPINTVVKAIMVIDAAAERWRKWDSDPATMPELDLDGKVFPEEEIQERLAFYREASEALNGIAEKATTMQLAEPIDIGEFAAARRTNEIAMIAAALGLSTRISFFTNMSGAEATANWNKIAELLSPDSTPIEEESTAIVTEALPENPDDEPVKKPTPDSARKNNSKK